MWDSRALRHGLKMLSHLCLPVCLEFPQFVVSLANLRPLRLLLQTPEVLVVGPTLRMDVVHEISESNWENKKRLDIL